MPRKPPAAASSARHVVHVDTRAPEYAGAVRSFPGGGTHAEVRRLWDAANPRPRRRQHYSVASVLTAVQCRRLGWGYSYEVVPAPPDGRHPSWVKLRWVLDRWDSLEGVVVILDTDAWIRDAEALEFVVRNMDDDTALVASAEPVCRETREHGATDMNGGFLCFRARDARVLAFFERAWADPGRYATAWPWEQATLCRELRAATADDGAGWLRVLPLTVCNTPAGTHVAHCWFKDLAHDLAVDDLVTALADWLVVAPAALPASASAAAPSVELVVARHSEDVSWVLEYLPLVRRVTVYDKSGGPLPPAYHPKIRVVALPNVGREAHTYLTHIVTHTRGDGGDGGGDAPRDALCDTVVFAQGRVTDHMSRADFERLVRGEARPPRTGLDVPWGESVMSAFKWTPDKNYTPGADMQPAGMTLGKFYLTHVADDLVPEAQVAWWPNAIFSASAERIRARPAAAWRRLLDLVGAHPNPELGHYMERFWRALL